MRQLFGAGFSLVLLTTCLNQVVCLQRSTTSAPHDKPCDAYEILGIQPPNTNSTLYRLLIFGPKQEQRLKRRVWKLHGKLLPLFHIFEGDNYSPELFVNLRVLWNKAISSLDRNSPVYEGNQTSFWTYRMLPRSSRWILKAIPSRFFPRWYHANIELRTAYLNRAIAREIDKIRTKSNKKIRLIVLGAGYDTRSIRLLLDESSCDRIDQAWEFDLP